MTIEETPEIDLARRQQELLHYDGPDKVVHFTDYLLQKASERSSHRTFNCDFQAFDEKIGGIQTGEVVVVTGYTKSGKTLFAESWIYSLAQKDPTAKAAIFSFEVQTEKLLLKYMKNETLPFYVPSVLKAVDFEWFKARCLEAKLKHDCRVVLIDHLHFMIDMALRQNMSLNIGGFMRKLKQEIAIGMDMAVILIAHQGQPREDREADISGIRDSSFVAQEADSVVIVSRVQNYSPIDMVDFRVKYGDEKADLIEPPNDLDKFSAGLALVNVSRTRRTGSFDSKKLFQKRGEFLVEV